MARKPKKNPLIEDRVWEDLIVREPPPPLPSPFIVQVDSREQSPYAFLGLLSDVREGSRVLDVRTHVAALASGDYSILGHGDRIAVERKSCNDLYGTLGQQRERFVRELERLALMRYAAVVVEAEWSEILTHPPRHSKLEPKTVFRSVIAWQQRYPSVHWLLCPDRDFAEAMTYRVLERYWRDHVREVQRHGEEGSEV